MTEALQDYIKEVEEEREKKGLRGTELSKIAFGNPTRYSSLLSKIKKDESVMVKTLESMANALGMNLVICLMEKEE